MAKNAQSVAGTPTESRADADACSGAGGGVGADAQTVGASLPGWTAPVRPRHEVLHGRFCRLEPLDPAKHAQALFDANIATGVNDAMWTYLAYGPFADFASYRTWMEQSVRGDDPLFFAVVEQGGGRPLGVAAYLRIDPANGVIEVGHLAWSPALQRTAAATEALYLLMAHVFELGYRRYEWKCDSLNAPSRAAATRLGFVFEGVFRQAVVVKGRNRDTAWFSILDKEWPARRAAFERWLSPENLDEAGNQRKPLSAFAGSSLGAGGVDSTIAPKADESRKTGS